MYYDLLGTIYRERFNCITDQLTLADLKKTNRAQEKIDAADIIYVGGGNSLRLLKRISKYGIDKMLEQAYWKDVVLCGLSAGAICWCKYGNSDSRNPKDADRDLIRVKALGFLDFLMCPHYDSQKKRRESLKRMMKRTKDVPAIALDDCAALLIEHGQCRVISEREKAGAYKIYWQGNEYIQKEIEKGVIFELTEISAI